MNTVASPPKKPAKQLPQANVSGIKRPEQVNIRQLHRFAGMTLAAFIVLHLANHLFALVSVQQHIRVMELLRLFYRNPIIETLLLSAILLQVPSGIMLVRRKGWRGLPVEERAQVASGLYLSFFLVVHVLAVMVGRYGFHLDTNFYFGAAPLHSFLWWYYVVYYGLSIIAIFTHIGSIHALKMADRTTLQRARVQGLVIFGMGIILAIIILAAFMGLFHAVVIPEAYRW
jgi:hypothetical protein